MTETKRTSAIQVRVPEQEKAKLTRIARDTAWPHPTICGRLAWAVSYPQSNPGSCGNCMYPSMKLASDFVTNLRKRLAHSWTVWQAKS